MRSSSSVKRLKGMRRLHDCTSPGELELGKAAKIGADQKLGSKRGVYCVLGQVESTLTTKNQKHY